MRRDLDRRRKRFPNLRQHSSTPLTTLEVEASPFFRTVINVPRSPLRRTMLVWGAKPSETVATSRM